MGKPPEHARISLETALRYRLVAGQVKPMKTIRAKKSYLGSTDLCSMNN
uniref:Uncharacterized protein n=1 Tax=uncultured alpha proteobacterium EF100_102A06 TaxID=710799 RepID=E0Y2B9_9PROT|nr:hypothetical protein [uncultured alpha proteobacterium EF100_102A06]